MRQVGALEAHRALVLGGRKPGSHLGSSVCVCRIDAGAGEGLHGGEGQLVGVAVWAGFGKHISGLDLIRVTKSC